MLRVFNIKRIMIKITDEAFPYASACSAMPRKVKISSAVSSLVELPRKRLYERITMIDAQAVTQKNKRPARNRLQRLDDGKRDTVSAFRMQQGANNAHPEYLLTIMIGEVLRMV